MGALREKMIAEMKLRHFAARTQKSCVAAMVGLLHQSARKNVRRLISKATHARPRVSPLGLG
jgi:hypothetical protein